MIHIKHVLSLKNIYIHFIKQYLAIPKQSGLTHTQDIITTTAPNREKTEVTKLIKYKYKDKYYNEGHKKYLKNLQLVF